MLTEVSPESVTAVLAGLRHDIHHLNKETFTTKIDQAINSLTTLQFGDTTLGSMKYIHSIINRLKPAKGLYLNKLEMKDEINGIMEMLRTLVDNTRLERMLQ